MERLDHAAAELLLQVPDVVGDVEHGRDPAGIFDCRERAAASVPGALPRTPRPLLQGDPDDIVSGLAQQAGRDARVDPSGEGDGNPHLSE
jgi:hypothetical protein